LRWDVEALWQEIRAGLRKCAGHPVESVAVDSWALDYVLMRNGKKLERAPFCYRDARTAGPYEAVRAEVGESRIYEHTGIQFMPINSVYHLVADRDAEDRPFEQADTFLMIGDWFHYLLSGRIAQEESNASTTQLWDPQKRRWSEPLIESLRLPRGIFPPVVPPETKLGTLRVELQEETGLGAVEILAGCVHDTGAAVAAVPGSGDEWAYISSGTWSLLGVELAKPLVTEAARRANFTNETGVDGTSRFLRNASGMWLLQECRRAWEANGETFGYGELAKLAADAPAFRCLVNPDDASFLRPENMPAAIDAYCERTGQPKPASVGGYVRCIIESLALLYDRLLGVLEEVTERRITTVHIVGGGSQNALLNQATADASARSVVSGPVEATAIGNLLLQAKALGHIKTQAELREIVRNSFELQTFHPADSAAWSDARIRFRDLHAGRK
jgi:rhamnulokinase